jgi:hypothetical protein
MMAFGSRKMNKIKQEYILDPRNKVTLSMGAGSLMLSGSF